MDAILADQVAIVTGSGRGIGRAIARRLARMGADIVVADLARDGLNDVVGDVESAGRRAMAVALDVGDRAAVDGMVHDALKHFGRIDILVNNAGVAKPSPFLEETQENWENHLRTNLTGAFNCSQSAARVMIKALYGRIISIASVAGLMGPIDFAAYGATKSGVIGLTRAMALDLAPYKITANAVAPGPVDTEMLRKNWTKEALAERSQHVPLGRLGTVDEIAYAVASLASPEAGYMSGVVLPVDGGSVAAGTYMVERYRRGKLG